MNYLRHLVTDYPIPTLFILFIWILSFANLPETPLDNVSLIDKWTHLAMYGGTTVVIWINYLRRHDKPVWTRLLCLGVVAPILTGGLIEILQATCTGGRRSGEWLDFAANTIGVVLGAAIGIALAKIPSIRKRD